MAVIKKEDTTPEMYGVQLIRAKRYMYQGLLYKSGEIAEVDLETAKHLCYMKEKFSKRPYFKIVLEPGQVMPDMSYTAKKISVKEANRPRVRSVSVETTDELGVEI